MSDRNLAKSVQRLSKAVWKMYRRLSKGFVTWLLRSSLMLNRQRRATAGFVLPTVTFLVLVVALTAGALSYRAFNSSTRTIGNIQSRAIYNAATPAIDRARSKIETLFKDPRYPGGVPSEAFLTSMMLNDGRTIKGVDPATPQPGIPSQTDQNDPYTLLGPNGALGERRIDINGDGLLDNAWVYHDAETQSSIVYSISFSLPADDPGTTGLPGWKKLLQKTDAQKALGQDAVESGTAGPFIRTGPLSNSEAVTCRVSSGSTVEQGWYQDATDTSKLRKRFQIDAFVVKDQDAVSPGKPPSITTLEFAQDRLLERGNKWGAWFRNDLEIFPGRPFNWNGAMHTEGSLLIRPNNNDEFRAFLISSPSSCLFLPESNSEISVRQVAPEDNVQVNDRFTGVVGSGSIRANDYGGQSEIHVYQNKSYDASRKLDPSSQLVNANKRPYSVSLDPATIVTSDGYRAREGDQSNFTDGLPAVTNTNVFVQGKRIVLDPKGDRPYVDDTYRADNRYGPKPNYGKVATVPNGKIGDVISAADFPSSPGVVDSLVRNTPVGDPSTVGLDGYWERRSIVQGLRILVGQRLELGNPAGWVPPKNRPNAAPAAGYLAQTGAYPDAGTVNFPSFSAQSLGAEFGDVSDLRNSNYLTSGVNGTNADSNTSDVEGDPLYPPYRFNSTNRQHEERQRRTLRDNLASVQATAVYHHTINSGTYPAACLATTAHPGSPLSLQQSVSFLPNPYLSNPTGPWVDFFYGKGTNGWEFAPPPEADLIDATTASPATAMGKALRNLAFFAGDLQGAFPPQQGTTIRPDPTLTMWGNFSNLRRALDGTTQYASLSPADKTYLHTAGCTLGMLAYNVNQVQNFNPSTANASDLSALARDYLFPLMNGRLDDGEVLTSNQLSTYDYGASTTPDPAKYNPRDYDNVTPVMFLASLRDKLQTTIGAGVDLEADPLYRFYKLALLIHENFQIRRDRTYGFRPSPASNTWNYNPFLVIPGATTAQTNGQAAVTLWSSACDPNVFNVAGSTPGRTGANIFPTQPVARQRLALSRLCGSVTPPGGVHDGVGDGYFPARGNTANPHTPQTPNPSIYQAANPNTDFGTSTSTPSGGLTPPLDNSQTSLRAQVIPEFPSLYYLFPEINHDHNGNTTTVDNRQPGHPELATALQVAFQPWKEPYITNPNVPTANTADENVFQVVGSTPVAGSDAQGVGVDYNTPTPEVDMTNSVDPVSSPNRRVTDFKYTAFSPFPTGADLAVDLGVTPKAQGSWVIPTAAPGANSPNRIVNPDGSVTAIAFQDKVMFNGREWQPARVMDLDLDMLRSTSAPGNESWLPVSGVVYAFREDAVREDAIARPSGTTTPPSLPTVRQTDARTIGAETDPPLAAGSVSTKPVDYIPDPDRRVHGFRLRNGERLNRTVAVDAIKNNRGLSFFTDNPAYIMGDFNKHQTANGDRLEEFTQQIGGTQYDTNTFYDQRTNRDPNFAKTATDEWRPSEVLADTISVLTNNFCDGGIIDTFMTANQTSGPAPNSPGIGAGIFTGSTNVYNGAGAGAYNNPNKGLFDPGCTTGQITSFMNQNRPSSFPASNWDWVHENPNDPFSPVKISRNGNGLVKSTNSTTKPPVPVEYTASNSGFAGSYSGISGALANSDQNKRSVQVVNGQTGETTVNTIFISGIVPTRLQQSYGGLHNFPRMVEWWNGVNLNFAGSFLQLNFSNYATAPYDEDVVEPATDPLAFEVIDYYNPPGRRWGYDVALQMVPAPPAASRFVTPGVTRNEFYTEPPSNDAYMQNLCQALKNNQAPGGPNFNGLNCPT